MIKITIPDNNILERTYILDVLFQDFLGLDILVSESKTDKYSIELPNKSQLIIKDAFFCKYPQDLEYLKSENIPTSTTEIINPFDKESKLQILFGENKFVQHDKEISCSIDIFASSFFMLTRWEEYVTTEKDEHKRFSDYASLAYKANFYKRPIVNEYIDLLKQMILKLDDSITFKKWEYTASITHDVDRLRRYDTFRKYFKALVGDMVHRKNLLKCFSTTSNYLSYKLDLRKDPYDTFDYLMDISEKHNLKSHFYFIPSKLNEQESEYNIESKEALKDINNIQNRGHFVGIHGSYKGFNNTEVFTKELKRIPIQVEEGRQHFLRFDNPKTWQIWEDNALKTDSTIAYSHFAGFRAGICYPYSVFNILSQKKLKLKEQPLIAMEGAVANEFPQTDDFVKEFKTLSNTCKNHRGNFVFLWHNNNFKVKEWEDYAKHYEAIINSII